MPTTRPILFSATLVRAILDGSKTVTRRVVLPSTAPRVPPDHMEPWIPVLEQASDEDSRPIWRGTHPEYPTAEGKWFTCPYGAPGDRLWVRETWGVPTRWEGVKPSMLPEDIPIYLRADGEPAEPVAKWQPSIFMPRWASRIELVVTAASAERLDETTEYEAICEGVDLSGVEFDGSHTPRDAFKELWNRINGPRGYGWDEDPWVWRVAFARVNAICMP